MNAEQARSQALQRLAVRVPAVSAPSLFDAAETAPTPDALLHVFRSMEAAGYRLASPLRAYPSRRRGWTEWHVEVSREHIQFILSFLVPEDVS